MSSRAGVFYGRSGPGSLSAQPVSAPGAAPVPELADVGRLWRRGVRAVVGAARAGEAPSPASRLREHLHGTTDDLPVVEESWPAYDHVNVQAGLDALLAEPGVSWELLGLIGYQHQMFGLAELVADTAHLGLGSVARVQLPSGPGGAVKPCVRCGVYLLEREGVRSALLLRTDAPMHEAQVQLQVISTDPDEAGRLASSVRALALQHNVFRGRMLSFDGEMFGPGQTLLQFLDRPSTSAEELILPPSTLDTIRRQVVDVARHRRRLLASGQHLKRGLLLYGPPGVGKTHTVRFLAGSLVDTTVIVLSGRSLHLVGEACSVARALQPAMIVIEDVDLIAEDRGMHPGQHPMLFQLLNEMDGLAEDADVMFVLTTNRADLLEPALASRPGRVDQAVALELPDRDARRRLYQLYRGVLQVDESRLDGVLDRTDGVTASFLKEMLRRAALLAALRTDPDSEPDRPLSVTADDLDAALDELLDTANGMTRTLLGGGSTAPATIDTGF